jgi:hypothetical protein
MSSEAKTPFSSSTKLTPLIERYCANRLPYEEARERTLAQLDRRSSTDEHISFVRQITGLYTPFLQGVCIHAKRYILRAEAIESISSLANQKEKQESVREKHKPLKTPARGNAQTKAAQKGKPNAIHDLSDHLPTAPRWIGIGPEKWRHQSWMLAHRYTT